MSFKWKAQIVHELLQIDSRGGFACEESRDVSAIDFNQLMLLLYLNGIIEIELFARFIGSRGTSTNYIT